MNNMNTEQGKPGMEQKCETGCKTFTGGEILHHKDCVFYPESISKMYADNKTELTHLRTTIEELRSEIKELKRKADKEYKGYKFGKDENY